MAQGWLFRSLDWEPVAYTRFNRRDEWKPAPSIEYAQWLRDTWNAQAMLEYRYAPRPWKDRALQRVWEATERVLQLKPPELVRKHPTISSFLLSWAFMCLILNPVYAIGYLILLGIHELGHILVARRFGIHTGHPIFLPFIGAFIGFEKSFTPWQEAMVGLGGPMLGAIASFCTLIAAQAFESQMLHAVAFIGILLNLANMLPILPLDGGRITQAFSRWAPLAGAVLGIPLVWKVGFSPIMVAVVLGFREMYTRVFGAESQTPRESVPVGNKVILGMVYAIVLACLIAGFLAARMPPDVFKQSWQR